MSPPTKAAKAAEQEIDAIMEQAQVFASAWAFLGGPFDNGSGLEQAEREKANLRAMLSKLRTPIAGEAQHDTDSVCAWQVWWNQNKGRYTTTRQASIAGFAAGKEWRAAAPQASAEEVRKAALEEAAQVAYEALHPTNPRSDWTEFAEHSAQHAAWAAKTIRALKQPQADKDGGQQRDGDGKTREAVDYPRGGALNFDDPAPAGATGIRSLFNACMYRNECRAMLDRQERAGDPVEAEAMAHLRTIANFGGTFEQAKELASRGVQRCAALSATQTEQGERDE
ncbi:hypothetical protein [Achromobacter insuavis]|uniref:hypothetical protein n=1 Tax=Achromobacter insuavis TaxID=1287735 RepID=UPI001F146915|nr:hypothetical protein [Achromobacter insuavis]